MKRRFGPLARVSTALLAVGAAAVAVVALTGGGNASASAGGTVHTSGPSLTLRSGTSTGSKALAHVPNGKRIPISCQTTGSYVSGRYGHSNIWDKTSYRGHTGYVSDSYVYTGSDGRVAPKCGGGGGHPHPSNGCSTSGLHDPHSCATAVHWAKTHVTSRYHSEYYRMCDHVVALAYGFSASGSVSASSHWTHIPSKYRHGGDRSVPAGGLAFFSTGSYGHVMISIGDGKFVSNDIHGNGTLTKTTIGEIESRWGSHYLGWAQPWFQANH